MPPNLELLPGVGTSARIVVILRVARERHFITFAERIYGPWTDPETANEQLQEIHRARGSLEGAWLGWLSVSSDAVVAAYLETTASS